MQKILFRAPILPLNSTYSACLDISSLMDAGLYLSSPALHEEISKQATLVAGEREKLKRTLYKYQLRAGTRATPYATFAGLTTATVEEGPTSLVLTASDKHRTRLRLDMNLLAKIVSNLNTNSAVTGQLNFTANNSLYVVPGGYRYAEYTVQNGMRKYHLSFLATAPYLDRILLQARNPTSISLLGEILKAETNADDEDLQDYLSQLIEAQVLVSDLEPTITGDDPLARLIDKLQQLKGTETIVRDLQALQNQLTVENFDTAHLKGINDFIVTSGLVGNLPKESLQADLFLRTAAAKINSTVVSSMISQTETLFCMSKNAGQPDLERFKNAFVQRYEDRQIPLAIALDSDLGIGYGNITDELSGSAPLIDELPVRIVTSGTTIEQNPLTAFAQQQYENWLKSNDPSIEITDDHLKPLKEASKHFRFPNSMCLMGRLMKHDGILNADNFRFDLSSVGGPSAGNLLGRFTYGDEEILQLTRQLLAEEEANDPNVIFAEIAHLPQARIGNILLRPILRKYEIPYVGLSGVPKEFQIPIDDLWVKVEAGEVVLWSERHNKRVIPRLTTAHNFSYQSLPVYKFLCDLQMQGMAYPIIWDWGALATLRYLPRVVYKSIIIHKARWIVLEKDLHDLPKESEEAARKVLEWQGQTKLPDRVVYKEGDNELLIDFQEDVGIELFLHYLKKYKRIHLEEFLFTEENAVVHNEQGEAFTNEIIIPLSYQRSAYGAAPFNEHYTAIPRSFPPGSEWLYFKIYSGTKTAEHILKEYLLLFVEKGISNNLFRQFFFIRYKDEASHIRIRFFVPDQHQRHLLSDELNQLLRPLLEQELIHKVTVDSYKRELERYGGEHTLLAEQLFYNDSLAVLRFVALLEGDEADRYRLLFALRSIDMLLDDFGLSVQEKHDLFKERQQSFFQEFGGHDSLKKALNDKYRQHQKDIAVHMDATKDVLNEIEDAVAVFQQRSEMNKPLVAALKSNSTKEQWMGWLPSYLHMSMNRLFIAQQRKYELVVYHFLERYYHSAVARAKSKKQEVS